MSAQDRTRTTFFCHGKDCSTPECSFHGACQSEMTNNFAKTNSALEREIDRRAKEFARKCNIPISQALEYAVMELDGEEKLNKLQEERAQDVDMEAADRMSQAYQQAIREGKSVEAALRAAEKAHKGR